MGAGKTTIGKALARKTGLEFFDLDWYVENRYRMKIPQFEDVVISCGGGTPCFFDNIDYMNSLAETVYLKAEPEVLRTHLLMAKSQRPLIQGKTPDELRDFIQESLAAREPFYKKAKHTIEIEVLERKELIMQYVNQICQELNVGI